MTLFEQFTLIKYIVNKDFSGNIITPETFKDLIKVVNIDLFRSKYGLPEEYQPGRPIPNEFVDITLKNTDDLKAFKTFLPNTPVVAGVLPYPVNYAHRDTVTYSFTKIINGVATVLPIPVEVLREEQFNERNGNYTKRPTTANPIGVVRSDGIHIRPLTITSVDYAYYRFPIAPVFAYVIGDGFITYDSAMSTEYEWPIDEHMTLTSMILQYIGVNLREADIIQYSELKKKEG
jgi:hypothetical protein